MQENFYSQVQIKAWIEGLLTIAWSDGLYDPHEKEVILQEIGQPTEQSTSDIFLAKSISPKELRQGLGDDPDVAQDFLRSAVMVAIADGIYSSAEFELIGQFSDELGLKLEAISSLEQTLCKPNPLDLEGRLMDTNIVDHSMLELVKDWLDKMEIKNPRLAHFLCRMIPAQCPFERDIKLFGHKIVHIPPMCKLNPLYEQLVGLRFRALSYLADICHEDITEYIK
jgi:tellurite resistance protein